MLSTDRAHSATSARSVSDVANQISDYLGAVPELQNLRVVGEVANLRGSPSGHNFFRLRDSHAALACVLFRYSPGAMHLEDGAQVICNGRANLYVNNGNLQIVASSIEPAGLGALQARLDELRRKLALEGLFEASRKRPLPRFPKRIAVITAEGGSVLQDILTALTRRYPLVEVVLLPVPVQGAAAASSIADAFSSLAGLHSRHHIDAAILARGGGSLEDLMAFNDESVARAVFACPIPVISAIGHETDTTISDLVADVRAPTPTAAAELVSPDRLELRSGVNAAATVMRNNLVRQLDAANERHQQTADRLQQSVSNSLGFAHERLLRVIQQLGSTRPDPSSRLRDIEYARNRLNSSMTSLTDVNSERLRGLTAQLRALSHLDTLKRGFAIVRGQHGQVISRAIHVKAGDTLQVQFADGQASAETTDVQVTAEGTG